MVSYGTKKWIIAGLILIGIIVFALSRQETRTDKADDRGLQRSPVSESFMEFNMKEKSLLELVEKNPEDAELHARLGDLYFENQRFARAIEPYKKALEINPQDLDSYNDLGLSYHYTGRPDIAIETLKKGTAVNPDFQRIWLSLGFVLTASGKTEEAAKALQKTIELSPNTEVGREAKRILELIRQQQ